MTLYKWSQTASADAAADSTINWAEGQSPSSVNDSARAMMAATAKYRDDIAGAIVTGGTSTAYTVLSYQVFDTLAHLNGQMIAFTPHTTNGNVVTLNADGLGARPLRSAPNVELGAGTIIQGTPYVATYNNSDGAFYLQGFYGNPYNVPISAGFDYWGPTTPNSSFAFPIGQAISRTTYASLFSGNPWSIGTTYGVGDGSTTFNLPDKTGRVSAMIENGASRLTPTYFGGNSNFLGAVGGGESHALVAGEIPSIASSGPITVTGTGNLVIDTGGLASSNGSGSGPDKILSPNGGIGISLGGTASVTSSGTNGSAHRTVQPTICCNYIIRII